MPPVPKDEYEKQFLPQAIQVNFRPKKNVLYKSKFRFLVENGLPCDVILKGKGSYEEEHDWGVQFSVDILSISARYRRHNEFCALVALTLATFLGGAGATEYN